MFDYACGIYRSLENYTDKRFNNLVREDANNIKRRIILGVGLYSVLCLTNSLTYTNTPSSLAFSCPPEIKDMTQIQKIVGPIFLTMSAACMGVVEEVFFREIVQNYGMKEGISSLLERSSLKNLFAYWNGMSGKITRITFLTSLFVLMHIPQYAFKGEMMTRGLDHALRVVPLGLMTASLQELDEFGSITAIGLHATNNVGACLEACYRILSAC